MKPVLPHLLHETQFSQPGKNIGQLIAMIRDLRHDMHQGGDDAFFVSVDFMKAFDNVDHSYGPVFLICKKNALFAFFY